MPRIHRRAFVVCQGANPSQDQVQRSYRHARDAAEDLARLMDDWLAHCPESDPELDQEAWMQWIAVSPTVQGDGHPLLGMLWETAAGEYGSKRLKAVLDARGVTADVWHQLDEATHEWEQERCHEEVPEADPGAIFEAFAGLTKELPGVSKIDVEDVMRGLEGLLDAD